MSKAIFSACEADIAAVADFLTTFGLTIDRVPKDGGWTASQCLAHLADAEISLALRIRMMLTSDNYNFSNWDEDAFAALKANRDPKNSVEIFKSLRRSNLELLSELDETQLMRTGIRPNGEPITIIDYLSKMSEHVRGHLDQAITAARG